MPTLDPMTLWMADVLVHAFGALVWAMLAGFYRIAPRAAWLLCAASLLAIPALGCSGCSAPWPGASLADWQRAALALLSTLTLERGARRLLHAPSRLIYPLVSAAAIVAAAGAALLLDAPMLAWRISTSALALLFAGVALLLYTGTRDARQHRLARLALCLPFAVFAVALMLSAIDGQPLERSTLLHQLLPIALHLWIPLSLMILAVRRLWLRIDHLARHDPLTGLLNRRALQEALDQAQAALRRGQPFAWIVLDIDHFKRVNDALGHAGGDAALVHVAGLLGRECRAVDRLARLGGEEFGLLLPGSDQGAALALAARLHQRLHEQPLQWQGQVWPLRASFGVALGEAGDDAGCTRLLQRADQLLYQAKAQGRDRICVETAVQGDAA
jgi:diguanylate cyclase (GGDEF)-like protein